MSFELAGVEPAAKRLVFTYRRQTPPPNDSACWLCGCVRQPGILVTSSIVLCTVEYGVYFGLGELKSPLGLPPVMLQIVN